MTIEEHTDNGLELRVSLEAYKIEGTLEELESSPLIKKQLENRLEELRTKYDIEYLRDGNERSVFNKMSGAIGTFIANISQNTKGKIKDVTGVVKQLVELSDTKEAGKLSTSMISSIQKDLCGVAALADLTELNDNGLTKISKVLNGYSLLKMNDVLEQYLNGNKDTLTGLGEELNDLGHLYENPKKYFKKSRWFDFRHNKVSDYKNRDSRGLIKRIVGFKNTPIVSQQVVAVDKDKVTFFLIINKGGLLSGVMVTETISDKYKEQLMKAESYAFSKSSLITFCREVTKYADNAKFDKRYLNKVTDGVDSLEVDNDGSQETKDRKYFAKKIMPVYIRAYASNIRMSATILGSVLALAKQHLGIYKKGRQAKGESDAYTGILADDVSYDESEYRKEEEEFNKKVSDSISMLGFMGLKINEKVGNEYE